MPAPVKKPRLEVAGANNGLNSKLIVVAYTEGGAFEQDYLLTFPEAKALTAGLVTWVNAREEYLRRLGATPPERSAPAPTATAG